MREHKHVFSDPKFILDFIQVCDRAVLLRDWRVEHTIHDPRNLIDYIRRAFPGLRGMSVDFDADSFFDDVCDLVDMVVGATACGTLHSLEPLKRIKDQIDVACGHNPERMFDHPYTIPLIRTLATLNKEVAGGLDGVHGIYKSLIA